MSRAGLRRKRIVDVVKKHERSSKNVRKRKSIIKIVLKAKHTAHDMGAEKGRRKEMGAYARIIKVSGGRIV